jgi:hypothetical protein
MKVPTVPREECCAKVSDHSKPSTRLSHTSGDMSGHIRVHVEVNPIIVVGGRGVDESNASGNASLVQVGLMGDLGDTLEGFQSIDVSDMHVLDKLTAKARTNSFFSLLVSAKMLEWQTHQGTMQDVRNSVSTPFFADNRVGALGLGTSVKGCRRRRRANQARSRQNDKTSNRSKTHIDY